MLQRSAPHSQLPMQIGLRAPALRGLGDPDFRRLHDYNRFTAQILIASPLRGFARVEGFNAAFSAFVASLHTTVAQPIDQTLFGGTQSFGRLWARTEPVVAAFQDAMLSPAKRFVEALPGDPGHKFLSQKSTALACAGAWSVMLSSGGG